MASGWETGAVCANVGREEMRGPGTDREAQATSGERTRVRMDSYRTSLARDVGDITSNTGAKEGNLLLLTS